jgi:diguanylate cyclase (GGDEF)-like protein/PAS domain S-box-containing protein
MTKKIDFNSAQAPSQVRSSADAQASGKETGLCRMALGRVVMLLILSTIAFVALVALRQVREQHASPHAPRVSNPIEGDPDPARPGMIRLAATPRETPVLTQVDDPLHGARATAMTETDARSRWTLGAPLTGTIGVVFILLVLMRRNSRTVAARLRRALERAEEEPPTYRVFFEAHPLPVLIVEDESLDILLANRSAVQTFGHPEARLRQMSLRDLRHEEQWQGYDDIGRRRAVWDSTCPARVRVFSTRSGERRSMNVHHVPIEFAGRAATMCVMVDVTDALAEHAELRGAKEMLEQVLDHIPQGVAWKGLDLRYAGGNEVYARDAGLPSRTALVGLTDSSLRWGEDPFAVQAEDALIMAGRCRKTHFERETTAVDGTRIWISETRLPLEDPRGAVVGVLTAYEDITERRHAELFLRLQSRAIDSSVNGIVIAGRQGDRHVVLSANSAFERMTGYRVSEVVGIDLETLFALSGGPWKWQSVLDALARGGEADVTLSCLRKSGERFWNRVLLAPVPDAAGHVAHHIAVMTDVTELIESRARLERLSRYDALTGLPNRTCVDEHLAQALQQAGKTAAEMSVLFMGIDRFKDVNDSLGRRGGDAVLVEIANRLRRAVGKRDFVGRYGGDEFVVVSARTNEAGNTNVSGIEALLSDVSAAMNAPVHAAENELYVETSIGVSVYPRDGDNGDTLIRAADAAMYFAKACGRNGYQFYRPELGRVAEEKLRISTRLRRAVSANELHVVYQPQVDMVTGRMTGVEALVRWFDEELGPVPPAVFIPIAEETGLIRAIGETVLRTACRDAAQWRERGLPPVRVSVNVSPVQLERPDLLEVVQSTLTQSGWPSSLLELEVTEGALMNNAEEAARVLSALRGLGIRIAIDDFGTGYSSLSYLKRFSVDRIKIDRAFVKEIGRQSEYEALTLAVIAMASALKFDVIAEGVETEAQRDFLIGHGCIEAQGFLYSAAVSSAMIADRLGVPA